PRGLNKPLNKKAAPLRRPFLHPASNPDILYPTALSEGNIMSILPLGAAAQVMLLQSQIATNALLLGIPGGFAISDKPSPTGRKAILNAMGWGTMALVTLSLALAL